MIGVVVLGTCAFLGTCLCACCKTETAGGCCKMGAMTLCVFIIVALSKFLIIIGQQLTNGAHKRSLWHIMTFITPINIY